MDRFLNLRVPSHRTLRDRPFEVALPRHFVPGYDRIVPLGHSQQALARIGYFQKEPEDDAEDSDNAQHIPGLGQRGFFQVTRLKFTSPLFRMQARAKEAH